ncbi:MAG: VWA domain-containing protein [Acidobacteriia bacterium]|nr:VWA domain-containing protein [Terriglobia bacterium]
MVFTRTIGLTAIVVTVTTATIPGQAPSLATVMERASGYATAFQRQLSNIVAEERYVQDISRVNVLPSRFATATHRELRSDFLLVRPGGADRYVAFRDVFEVDGRSVRDRQDRLTTLFLDPAASAEAQIQRINRESARYNIGNIERTINTPTLALLFLMPQHLSRFRFTRSTTNTPSLVRSAGAPRGASFAVSPDAWVVEYDEVDRPTLIRTTGGLDLPARGRFWIDPATGRVLMSEVITEDPTVRATIDVRYQSDPTVGLMVPAEMRERYEGRRDGAVIEGNATYGRIRQFQVQANERLGPAEKSQIEPPDTTAAQRRSEATPPPVPDPVAAVAAPIAAPAVQDQPARQTFKTGTELVLVDFVVSDRADRPVRGLTAKDFVVKEDGKERAIVSFEAFAGDDSVPAARSTPPESPVRAAHASPGAATVLLVDDGQLSLAQTARLRPALKALLAKVGERSGSLMLVAPGSKVSLGLPPTGAADMAAAIDRIVGQRIEDQSNFPVADAEALAIARRDIGVIQRVAGRFVALNPDLTNEQAHDLAIQRGIDAAHAVRMRRENMYDVALQCLDWLASQPGRHSLIVVSGGFARDPDDAKYYEVVTRSLRANAPMHFLDARGLQAAGRYQGAEVSTRLSRNVDEGPFGWSDAAQGSTDLADDTGGIIISNTNDMAKGFGRLLDTMTTYYLLAYQPPAHEKPGFRKIKVEVRARGLHVRARSGYFSGPPAPR